MKRVIVLMSSAILLTFELMIAQVTTKGVIKTVNVGKLRVNVLDNGSQGEAQLTTAFNLALGAYDWSGDATIIGLGQVFEHWIMRANATLIAVKNWTDPVGMYSGHPAGSTWAHIALGAPNSGTGDLREQFAIPDANGITIHKYWRYRPPTITVNGNTIMSYTMATDGSEEIAPNKIPGTADMMVESHCRTYLGIDIRQRVLGWSQKNHDDYVIYEMVFKNTGIFSTINGLGYPDSTTTSFVRPQTLDSVFIYRSFLAFTKDDLKNSRARQWGSWTAPMDSLRICYIYPARMLPSTAGSTPYDNAGWPLNNFNQPRICAPHYSGEVLLFVSKNVNDMTTDDPTQPKVRTVWDMRPLLLKDPLYLHLSEVEQKWDAIVHGLNDWNTSSITKSGYIYPPRYSQFPQYPYYEQPPDRGNVAYIENIAGWGDGTTRYMTEPKYSMGPYTLQPGDSIRVVFALTVGTISKRKGFDIGTQWWNYENDPTQPPCAPPPGCSWNNGSPVDNLPPQYKVSGSPIYDNQNDWAKDCWVSTGKDSLFMNACAAQWNANHNFNIPAAPPPPSITVTKAFGANMISWGNESESASDFEGYRVYHARGSYADSQWVKVFETRKGASLTHQFRDSIVAINESYYYYVTAFNDGSQGKDFNGIQDGVESGMYANLTMLPSASYLKAVSNMDSIRVVPNPFNLAASSMNYSGTPNKIRFVNIPNECTIRIFTESGDLIKTIHHKGNLSINPNGEGSQDWSEGEGVSDNGFQLTSSGQRPVSGIYIANITTPDGRSKNVKFVIIR